jgi:hypothetical protein
MKRTYDSWLNAIMAEAIDREERAIATLDKIEARRLEGASITRAEWQDGRVYINDQHFFNDIPETTWQRCFGGYQVAMKWLVDRRCSTLSFEDAMQYLRLLRNIQRASSVKD